MWGVMLQVQRAVQHIGIVSAASLISVIAAEDDDVELYTLTWRDAEERGNAGQVTVSGNGGKTRVVLLSASTWGELLFLRDGADLPGVKRGDI